MGMGYSVKLPEVVTLATLSPFCSVNQRLPSGPAAIPNGLLVLGTVYSVKTPAVVTLATLFKNSANHRFPSGPDAMLSGTLAVGAAYSVISPTVARALPLETIS